MHPAHLSVRLLGLCALAVASALAVVVAPAFAGAPAAPSIDSVGPIAAGSGPAPTAVLETNEPTQAIRPARTSETGVVDAPAQPGATSGQEVLDTGEGGSCPVSQGDDLSSSPSAGHPGKRFHGFCRCGCSTIPDCNTSADCGGGVCSTAISCC